MKSTVDIIQKQIEDLAKETGYVWFLESHTKKVLEHAKWLCERLPEADREVVELSVWLHDIFYFIDFSRHEEHAVLGAEEASRRLRDLKISEETIAKVADAIRCHSCKEEVPATVEAKILATADAMIHFDPYFFLSLVMSAGIVERLGVEGFRKHALKKLDKDISEKKMFFDFARERVYKDYLELKTFFGN